MVVLELVRQIRGRHPRMGGRKLYELLKKTFAGMGIKVGRDTLFGILRDHELLIEPKRNFTVTTKSFGRFYQYKDHYNDQTFTSPNQAWVSDITYIRVGEGFEYLSLITDAYSRKIVGWELGPSLETKWTLEALKMALKGVKTTKVGIVHHSDRGFQYTSKQYTGLLEKNKMVISMGEAGNCYDNALAERVNGILKQEYLLDRKFKDSKAALACVKQAVQLYNQERPHMALNYKAPEVVHSAA